MNHELVWVEVSGRGSKPRGWDRRAGVGGWERPSPLPPTPDLLVEGHISLRQRIQGIGNRTIQVPWCERNPLAESLSSAGLGQKGWLPPKHASDVPSHQPPTLLSQEPSHFSGTPSLNSSITHHSHNFAECPRWGRGRG